MAQNVLRQHLKILVAKAPLGYSCVNVKRFSWLSSFKFKEKEQARMTQVVVGENEGIESALRRFKRQVSKAGIFSEVKRRRHFETPQEKRKRKAVARRKKRYR